MTKLLSDIIETPENGFNQARLAAAVAVVASHSFMLIYGIDDARPLSWGPYEMGALAVNVFFILSGLLLSHSIARKPQLLTFLANRALRIFPALLVSGFVIGWVVLPLSMGRGLEYFADSPALWYPLSVTWMLDKAHLDGAFAFSTYPDSINAPLWTIKYELLAYLCLGFGSAIGLFRNRRVTLTLCVIMGMLLLLDRAPATAPHAAFLDSLVRFGFCFMLGVAAYQYRRKIRLNGPAAIAALALAVPLGLTVIGPVAWIVAAGYGALVLAGLDVRGLTRVTRRYDISFGVYLYAWPVQQVLLLNHWSIDALGVGEHLLLSLLLVAPVALMSWLVVERPVLRLKVGSGQGGAAKETAPA